MWKAPSFWWKAKTPPWPARALSWLYQQGMKIHRKRADKAVKAPAPVISLGSLLMGGSGKTPLTLMMAQFLLERGFFPVAVTRGYSGKEKGPLQVSPFHHTPQDVGEEALLLASAMPTFVSARRSQALPLLPSCPNLCILLDDGHQHTSLYKDLSFLVFNSHQKWGNQHVFPAGPLREPWKEGIRRADGVFYIDETPGGIPPSFQGLPLFHIKSAFTCPLPRTMPVIGFAGLGYPQRFHTTLKSLFDHLEDFVVFPDHQMYTASDEKRLKALSQKAALVTTAKDWIKLSPELKARTAVVNQALYLEDPSALEKVLWAAGLRGAFAVLNK